MRVVLVQKIPADTADGERPSRERVTVFLKAFLSHFEKRRQIQQAGYHPSGQGGTALQKSGNKNDLRLKTGKCSYSFNNGKQLPLVGEVVKKNHPFKTRIFEPDAWLQMNTTYQQRATLRKLMRKGLDGRDAFCSIGGMNRRV